MDRKQIDAVKTRVLAVLKEHCPELGVAYSGGSFNDTTLFMKIGVTPGGASAQEAATQTKFSTYAPMLGLPADCFQATFPSRGETFTIVDLEPSRPKFPVIASRADGKRFKFAAQDVARLLTPRAA